MSVQYLEKEKSDVRVTGNARGWECLLHREVAVLVNALEDAKAGCFGADVTMNVKFGQRLPIPVRLITAKILCGKIHERPNLGR